MRYFMVMLLSLGYTSLMRANDWRAQVLPVELTVGYAVHAIDLSKDGRLDIAIVDSKRFIWLEAPEWKLHVMHANAEAKADNVCFAPYDIDGDGDLDFAVGHDWQPNNTATGGAIGWLRSPADPRQSWDYFPIGEEPTTHRMRWIDWNQDGRKELVVAPLKGKDSKAPGFDNKPMRVLMFAIPKDPTKDAWPLKVLEDKLHVMHNLEAVKWDSEQENALVLASFEGVSLLQPSEANPKRTALGSGHAGTAPAIGSSEVRLGRLASGKRYLATIEPWHGDHVVVYVEPDQKSSGLWPRFILDNQLKWGHAVACANLDQDADLELVIGVRDNASDSQRSGVRVYDPIDSAKGEWKRTLIEPGQVAVEDMVTGDFDGDGDQDIAAVGRATHNAVIYWQE